MHRTARVGCLLAIMFLLSGCTPALYVRLFNATGKLITVSKSRSNITTIAAGTAVDISPFQLDERLLIRCSNHFWSYPMRDFYQPHWPLALWEQHVGVMRTYARIDSRGRIYVLAPPEGSGQAREIPQPRGFPMLPRNET
jgi:hypothetical protein